MEQVERTVKLWDKLKTETVDAIANGIRLFKDILEGNINIADVIKAFGDAIKTLPDKVKLLRIVLLFVLNDTILYYSTTEFENDNIEHAH